MMHLKKTALGVVSMLSVFSADWGATVMLMECMMDDIASQEQTTAPCWQGLTWSFTVP